MRSVITWLKEMENLAYEFYHGSSKLFNDDKELTKFLRNLAHDEKEHYTFLDKASKYIRGAHSEIGQITINDRVKGQIEAPLRNYNEVLKENSLSKKQLLSAIVEIEYSELNALFLYTVNLLRKFNKTFQYASAAIQTHKSNILAFFEARDDGKKYIKVMKSLPNLWEKRMLIVEDNELLRDFYREFLKKKAKIETSKDGAKALSKLKGNYYDVIIADIEMPTLNGIDFFKKAIEAQPELERNFIFCSGYISAERKEYLKAHNVPFLAKPIPVGQLENLVDKRLKNE